MSIIIIIIIIIIILNGSRHNTMVMIFIQIKLRWFAVKSRNG